MLDEKNTVLTAFDGHQLGAFVVEPDKPKSGLVILQEIFGVTEHMKNIARQYASQGYRTVVPALFDRIEQGKVIPYSAAGEGRSLASQCQQEDVLQDIQAAAEFVSLDEKVAVLGFCWGGTFAYLSASELKISAAIAYYGTRIIEHLNNQPNCPLLLHFGAKDPMITTEHIEQIRAENPSHSIYVYKGAGHAFNNTERSNYHRESSLIAQQRTLTFLRENVN